MTVGREALERRVASGWILAGLFLLLLLPACLDVTRYHGDERFYTDAAVSMVKSGDWLSPRYPDGRLQTLGVYLPGDFEFHSDGAETVLVTSGCAEVLFPGDTDWRAVRKGEVYDVPANTVFKVRCTEITEYICDFL